MDPENRNPDQPKRPPAAAWLIVGEHDELTFYERELEERIREATPLRGDRGQAQD